MPPSRATGVGGSNASRGADGARLPVPPPADGARLATPPPAGAEAGGSPVVRINAFSCIGAEAPAQGAGRKPQADTVSPPACAGGSFIPPSLHASTPPRAEAGGSPFVEVGADSCFGAEAPAQGAGRKPQADTVSPPAYAGGSFIPPSLHASTPPRAEARGSPFVEVGTDSCFGAEAPTQDAGRKPQADTVSPPAYAGGSFIPPSLHASTPPTAEAVGSPSAEAPTQDPRPKTQHYFLPPAAWGWAAW